MTLQYKLEHLLFLTREIRILEDKLQPEDTGHIRTAIRVLESRVDEVKADILKIHN